MNRHKCLFDVTVPGRLTPQAITVEYDTDGKRGSKQDYRDAVIELHDYMSDAYGERGWSVQYWTFLGDAD